MQSVDQLNTLVLAGGRGGGKSILLIWLIGYFELISGETFNGVLIRRDLMGLSKFEDLLFQQVPTLISGSKDFKAKRQLKLSNGGTLRLNHMDAGDAFNKIQGRTSAISSGMSWGRKLIRRWCCAPDHRCGQRT